MTQKKLSLFLAGFVGLWGSFAVQAADSSDVDADDNGLIEISTLAELDLIREDLAGTSLDGNSTGCPDDGCVGYELTADLDFDTNGDGMMDASDDYWNDGAGWLPVGAISGMDSEAFAATFAANGYRISNLYIQREDADEAALFAKTDSAVISDLLLDGDLAAISGTDMVAAISGSDSGSSLSNIVVHMNISASGNSSVGGLVGAASATEITLSKFIGSVSAASADAVGGMIGYAEGAVDGAYIVGLVNYSYVHADITGDTNVGGIVGNAQNYNVRNSLTDSSVSGASYVGGILGQANPAQVTNVAVFGSVTAESAPAGGISGYELYSTMQYLLVAAELSDDDHSIRPYSGSQNSEYVYQGYWNPELSNLIQEDATTALTTAQLTCRTDSGSDETCTDDTIAYEYWDTTDIWSLGNSSEYAAPLINGMAARDPDGDGLFNAEDDDDDNDGVIDENDAFPLDATETTDTDGDGVGDNTDAFPDDASETTDTDADGTGNNADADDDGDGVADDEDSFPLDAAETADSDKDGIGDNSDPFPNDSSEWNDYDGDGVGDNSDVYPYDGSESADSDGDGVGDNSDAFPADASETTDSDGDGVGDNGDAFPDDATETTDTDEDGIGNNTDTDDDGDGVADTDDAFPTDATGSSAADSVDADGDGLIDIVTLDDLNSIRDSADGSSLSGVTAGCPDSICAGYELINDLDFDTNGDGVLDENDSYWNDGAGWSAIASLSTVFEGNGYSINNLYVKVSGWFVYAGLFNALSDATISNLTLGGELASVSGGTAFSTTGALAATMSNVTIENVSSSVKVSTVNAGYSSTAYMGGLIGNAPFSSGVENVLRNISVTADISAENSYAGGIIGSLTFGTIDQSHYSGTITSTHGFVGGLVGWASNSSNITLSYADVDITSSSGSYVGGLTGRLYGSSEVSDSYSTGAVTGVDYVGGIAGESADSSYLYNVYSLVSVTGDSNAGPLSGTLDDSGIYIGTSYWSSANNPELSDEYSVSATNAELTCPTTASDSTCAAGTTLYDGWDTDSWDFGSNEQYPVLIIASVAQRDVDADGVMDSLDAFPDNAAASVDADADGYPDAWNETCDSDCQSESGLTIDPSPDDQDNDGVTDSDDAFPADASASVDADEDGYPDEWNSSCDETCQAESTLTLDSDPTDADSENSSNSSSGSGGGSLFWLLGLAIPAVLRRRQYQQK